jgi:hypothetical protein
MKLELTPEEFELVQAGLGSTRYKTDDSALTANGTRKS